MKEEVWKDVVEWEGFYKVSSFGRIFSVRRNSLINLSTNMGGYKFFMAKNGRIISNLLIHRQVAVCFLDNPSQELVEKCSSEHHGKVLVNHRDGDKENNFYQNLEWCDGHFNMAHASEIKLLPAALNGVNSPQAAIKDLDSIKDIRENYVPYSKLFGVGAFSIKYGVSRGVISKIVLGKTYKED